jgi:hypothetical protein
VGPDRIVPQETSVPLQAQVIYTNAPPLTLAWRLYSGPATVTLAGTNQAVATATFHAPGVYMLMFGADDGVHAVAYDALEVTVPGNAPLAPTNLRTISVD